MTQTDTLESENPLSIIKGLALYLTFLLIHPWIFTLWRILRPDCSGHSLRDSVGECFCSFLAYVLSLPAMEIKIVGLKGEETDVYLTLPPGVVRPEKGTCSNPGDKICFQRICSQI